MTSKFYVRPSKDDPNSFNVFERGRVNGFGEPYCHEVAVTEDVAFGLALVWNERHDQMAHDLSASEYDDVFSVGPHITASEY